jgi:hypothetical protein
MSRGKIMNVYTVGQPYNPRVRSWPPSVQYNYRGGEHELILFWPRPSAGEIAGVKSGEIEVGFLVHRSVILFLYKISGACDWSDAPYSWHRVPESERSIPLDRSDESRALLHVILVDATDGIVRALRVVTIPTDITRYLHTAIRIQAASPYGPGQHDADIADAYRLYPHSREIARVGRTGRAGK